MTKKTNKSRKVAVGDVKTHPGLQPRDLSLLKQREQDRYEKQRQCHIDDMAALLKSDAEKEMHPVALARVDGVLFVVDGHHRLQAYKRAKRPTIPALVEDMTIEQASNASKLANVQFTKLEMHKEQKRNALWHHLAHITQRGNLGLPEGVSQRKLAGAFGVALDTVQRMLARLPEVEPSKYEGERIDAITGFPHWKYVRNTARNDMWGEMTPDSRTLWQSTKYAAKLAKLWEQFPPEAIDHAHALLRAQAEQTEDTQLETVAALDAAWMTSGDTEGEPW